MLEQRSTRMRRERRHSSKPALKLAAALILLIGHAAAAQDAPAPAPAGPSVVELKAQAYDAQERARAAEAAAAEAKSAADQAREAAAKATDVGAPTAATTATAATAAAAAATTAAAAATPPVAATPTTPASPVTPAANEAGQAEPAADPTVEALRQATEEAKNAAAAARAATAALEAHLEEREKRYSHSGFYLSGGIFWAPELFDTSLQVSDSRGAWGSAGYHFAERFEVEARFEVLDDFDLLDPVDGIEGTFDGWAGTLNARIFLLTKVFQPYLGMGLGVMQGRTRFVEVSTGRSVQYDDTVATFRISGGFDFYVTETLALTADAAINMPGGEINAANYATLGGGLKLRF